MPNSIYLRSIELKNTGPIDEVKFELPFEEERPLPLVIVGTNGSGKSTVFSFIVNALVAFKQHVFKNVEVEEGKVYRLRSGLSIRGGQNYYHSTVRFDQNASLEEWQLTRTRNIFEAELSGDKPLVPSWNEIPEHETSHFSLQLGNLQAQHKMEEILRENCTLFFGADRFEPPDWLNIDDLTAELRMPEPSRFKDKTDRRIFARNRLKPTMEWLASVIFDMLLHEHSDAQITLTGAQPARTVTGRLPQPGVATGIFNAVTSILREVLLESPDDAIRLQLAGRQSRIISVTIFRNGAIIRTIRDLLSLSAGESALFCIFASILRDADQAGIAFTKTDELRGIVLIDEVDLHLHLGLQYKALPKLIAQFPSIQFIISAHSPLVALGMSAKLTAKGLVIREMPSGKPIDPETYTEFSHAFELFSQTKTFRDNVLAQALTKAKPIVLVEGKTDAKLLSTAWTKLNPEIDLPFTPIGCGADSGAGGAQAVNQALRYLTGVFDKKVIAIFDNDRAGAPQFSGLKQPDFLQGIDGNHKKHATKDVHAILLPVPTGREIFVPASHPHRVLEIGHYFTDEVLQSNGMMGPPIYTGAPVFEIIGNKVNFSEHAVAIDSSEFAAFTGLFARIAAIQ